MTYLEEKSFVHSLFKRRDSLKKRGLEETSAQCSERLAAFDALRVRAIKVRAIMQESRKKTITCKSGLMAPVAPKKESLYLVIYKNLYITKAWVLMAKGVEDACAMLCVLKPQFGYKRSGLTAREYSSENLELNAERI